MVSNPRLAQDRVRGPVTGQLTPLKGQTRRMGPAAEDLGEVTPSLSTGRMVLWLRRSAEQQAQLGQFLSQAQNSGSASYRRWLTPSSFGAAYGISDHDLAAVEQWLQSSGLKVEKVSAGRNAILFSGTAGDIASTFHTSIHSYNVGQERHFSNATDPKVPTALAPVIAGISPMNDFRPKPLHVLGTRGRYDAASHSVRPSLTLGDSTQGNTLFVTPADASIIYNTPNQNFNPAATRTLDGTGVSIGIVGYSALAMADVQNYRKAFLPVAAAANMPTQVLDGGTDPGILGGGSASEGLLDAEVAGGLAPGAQIYYYYAASTDLSDGLVLASLRALEDNKVSILSVSYGACEENMGVAGNLEWSELWQQAAAQGISVTVSTGDAGSATCDQGQDIAATNGLTVNGLASTPYNIAVGGTDFYPLLNHFSDYVGTASLGSYPYYATALGYIPENPWNDSSTAVDSFTQNVPTVNGVGETNIIGGGGGLSRHAVCQGSVDSNGNCSQSLSGYPQPPYQTAFQQVTPVRSIPDVSLLAANGFMGATWVYCSDSTVDQQGGNYTDCQSDANGHLIDGPIGGVGGTSASAPAFAGMLAMISQSQGGARLGQANTVLYNLAQDYNPSPTTPGKYQKAFHDVTIGNNSVYCETGTLNCGANNFLEGYSATPSYDMATGLGSIDLSQLISLWTSTTLASTSNTLTASSDSNDPLSAAPIIIAHGKPITFAAAVTPADATGQFSIVSTASANAASFSDFGTLDGSATGNLTTNDLPGGTYTVYAYYAGDTNHTGSRSSNGISVTVNSESSTTTLSFGTYDPITNAVTEGISAVPYGMNTFINAQPFGNNSTVDWQGNLIADGIATGSVTFTSKDAPTQSGAINSLGMAQVSISSFPPGTYTYTASYPGDASFEASESTPQTLTITKAPTTLVLQPDTIALGPTSSPASVGVILETDSIALYPTGSVSAQANGHTYPASPCTLSGSNGANALCFGFTIPVSDLATGSNRVAVSYSGDSNYQASSASGSLVLLGQKGGFTLTGPDQPLVVQASQQGSTTISVAPVKDSGFTGLVNMTCTVTAATSGHTPTCQAAPVTVYGEWDTSSIVSVATFPDTPVGNYTITVVGTSGSLTGSVQIPLQVTDGPGFVLSVSDSSLSIASPGQTATDTLSIVPVQGFTGTVALQCIVAPTPGSGKAPTCTLPGSVTLGSATATATLQIATVDATAPGSYTVAVTAVAGAIQRTLAVPLVVQQVAALPTFELSAASNTVLVSSAGQSATDQLTLRPAGGFTGTVQLSCAVSGGTSTATPTCSVPATTSITGPAVVNATLTVNTTAPSTAQAAEKGRLFTQRIGGLMLGCLLIFVAPRRRIRTALGLLLLTAATLAVTACGGSARSSTGGGSTGTYTVTVKAVSGSIQATTQVNVTVQ